MSSSFALFSGGNDSLACTHWAMENGKTETVLHLDTNSGIPENREFVEETCSEFGWPLRIEAAPVTLYEFAIQYGFPGTAAHSWAYRYFKERQLRAVAKGIDGKPAYYTGVRRHESQRRLRTVKGRESSTDRWTWVSPFWDTRDEQVDEYRERYDLPINPVSKVLHRSGDCGCGAFANREEELLLFEAHFPNYYDWLMGVERRVQAEIGTAEPHCFWGHGGLPSKKLRALMARYDTPQLTLCDACLMDNADEQEGADE